ncbi:hypothetical protein NLG97_g1859 [Lecanicillium saksenae]|uniref:Uncharacterized protein n=1 Tax=Lecanicillium saksenae TaxID=468837 RepID=A0ACC1R3Y4_9HYPO|nr:hypothetical protein NLG97_g1859 [Lecanicillium saksenae]
MVIVIRRATVNDAADIARIHVQSWQETYRGMMPQSFLDALDIGQRTKNWTAELQNPNSVPSFVALVDGQMYGIAGGGAQRPPRDGDVNAAAVGHYDSEIYRLYVLNEAKGKGLGRKLMRAMADSLTANGMTRPMLWVAAANPTRAFYEHLGGKEFARKTEVVGGAELEEIGYGWEDMSAI